MIITHNVMAMNVQRQFNIVRNSKKKSTEKLSSGYKINRAADDAAGLAISEKMRKQIKGLSRGADNAQDGISMVQVADGAMAEIHAMLDRCVELSVQAANGILSYSDRQDIQKEIDQIKLEIEQTREKTKFNEIYVLKGDTLYKTMERETGNIAITGELPSWVTSQSFNDRYLSETYTTRETYEDTGTGNIVGVDINHSAAYIDFSRLDASNVSDLIGTGFYTTCCTCNNHYSIEFTDGVNNSIEKSPPHYVYKIGIDGVTDGDELCRRIYAGVENNGTPNNHYTNFRYNNGTLIVYDDRSCDPKSNVVGAGNVKWLGWGNPGFNVKANPGNGKIGPGIARNEIERFAVGAGSDPVSISLHVGADSSDKNKIEIVLPDISCETLGITSTNVLTEDSATKSIDEFGEAKQRVSEHRSRLGAYQNRLEHTYNNLDNVIENTTASESRIRDTDMAKEMVKYSNQNILEQAGVSLMTQANQSNQGVLTLLR